MADMPFSIASKHIPSFRISTFLPIDSASEVPGVLFGICSYLGLRRCPLFFLREWASSIGVPPEVLPSDGVLASRNRRVDSCCARESTCPRCARRNDVLESSIPCDGHRCAPALLEDRSNPAARASDCHLRSDK